MNLLTHRVSILDQVLKNKPVEGGTLTDEDHRKAVKTAHDHLLDGLRKTNRAGIYIHPDPDWEPYPIARDFFTQTQSMKG
jgi:hypothetical protein